MRGHLSKESVPGSRRGSSSARGASSGRSVSPRPIPTRTDAPISPSRPTDFDFFATVELCDVDRAGPLIPMN